MSNMHALILVPALLFLAGPSVVRADIVVIGHPDNPVQKLEMRQVFDLYLGRTRTLPNGRFASLLDQPQVAGLRARFYQIIAGMPLAQVNAYWARLKFTGQVLPPQSLADDQAVIEAVRRDVHAVGYVSATSLPPTVRVLLVLRE